MGDVSRGGAARTSLTGSNFIRTALVVTAAALLTGVAAYFILKTTAAAAAGDEPPIRVKGGSMYLELLHASIGWDAQGSNSQGKKWKVSGFDRKGEYFLVYLAPKDLASCPSPVGENPIVKREVMRIEFLYHLNSEPAKDYWIRLHATGNKTKVDSDLALDRPEAWLLSTKAADGGYIKEIHIAKGNGSVAKICTFASAGDLDSVLITEEP